jgi:teichuronic acid biosynthesis glycosyltransferase TuaC
MRVLVFTNMYPTEQMPFYGSFVKNEAESLRAAGVDVDVYFVNGRASKLNYLAMPFGFMRRMLKTQYDVVHVHHSYCGFVATMQSRVPVVWTFHEGEISSDVQMVKDDDSVKRLAYSKGFKRRIASKADQVIVVAEHLKHPLRRPDAVTLACGVDTARFSPMDSNIAKREIGVDPDRRYVLFPSSPDRIEKRHQLAADALSLYRREHSASDIELLCLDRVPHEQVPLYMNACELMLMTSAFEASPVTVREALSCNLPVLCTDVGDARTVLDGIDGCYIVEPDPDKIASVLAKALSGNRRVNSREAMAHYSLESTAEKLIQIYKELTHQ